MSGTPAFLQNLTSQRSAGTNFASYTTAKSVINATDLVTLPPNYMAVGNKLKVRAMGGLSSASGNTVTFQIMMGSVVAFTTGVLVCTTSTNTLLPWVLDVTLRQDSEGSGTAAKFMSVGTLIAQGLQPAGSTAGANPTVQHYAQVVAATAPAVGTGFDSTVSEIVDFWVGMGTSAAGNAIQIYDYQVDQYRFGA